MIIFLNALITNAQTSKKSTIYAEVGFGIGQTLFLGDIKEKLKDAYGGTPEPGTAQNLLMGFYYAPESWKGLGLGSRIKGTFGAPAKGEFDNDYIFNYYNTAITAKYYPLSKRFNKGAYIRGSIGFGQFTSKRLNAATNFYKHQYALGRSILGGLGYTFSFRSMGLSIDGEYDTSSRNGTIDGKGKQNFKSGQASINIIVTF
jgi:hypothetical protein